MNNPDFRYTLVRDAGGIVIFDRHDRKRIATIWWGGPAGQPADRIALRLAEWLNRLAAVDAENQRLAHEEEQ